MKNQRKEMLPFREARQLLDKRGFSRSISFNSGILKTQKRSFSPRRVVVMDKIRVRLGEERDRATLFALRTRSGLKGFLLDDSGEFSECLSRQCWRPTS